jgi:uncharacterized RDD family membrane protein YckC
MSVGQAGLPDGSVGLVGDRRGTPAGFVSRLIAFSIDSFVALLLFAVLRGVAAAITSVLGKGADSHLGPVAGALTVAGSVVGLFLAYSALGWWLYGRTLGKGLMGLRVVRKDGTNPHFLRSAVRAFGYLVSSILMLGFLWVLVDRRRKAWHDHLAGTWVVYSWDARAHVTTEIDAPLVPQTTP